MITIDSSVFKKFLGFCKLQGVDGIIKVENDILSCRGVSTDGVKFVDVKCFDLESDDEYTIMVDISTLENYISTASKTADFVIENKDRLYITADTKQFIINKLVGLKEMKPMKKFDMAVTLMFNPKDIQSCMKTIAKMSDGVDMRVDNSSELVISCFDDNKNSYIETLTSKSESVDFDGKAITAQYPVDHMMEIFNSISDFDNVTFRFSKDMPCIVTTHNSVWDLTFIVAPRIAK